MSTAILGTQVIDRFLLLAVDPAGQDGEEELPGLEDEVHGAGPAMFMKAMSISRSLGLDNCCPANLLALP